MSFDVLQEKIIETQNPTVAGLDPRIEYVPEHIRKACYEQYGLNLRGPARPSGSSTWGSSTPCAAWSRR